LIRPLLALLSALFLAAPAARAAEDPLALEAEALAKEGRLDYDAAFDLYAKALDVAFGTERLIEHPDLAAAAEVYLYKLEFLAEKTSRWKDFGAVLARLDDGRKGVPPLFRARCAHDLERVKLAAGDVAGAAKSAEAQGFITSFAICGPFDNERGGGFATAFDPEKKIDLTARYQGKAREVGWTIPERPALHGEVDLDAMLRPNDEVLAYALAYVRWDGEPHAVALRVGSDEGCKLFWNDREVLSRDVNRTLELDQDAVAVTLEKGWNKLLVKVAERKGPWGFMVRVTEPDGSPLEGKLVQADEAVLRAGVPLAKPGAAAPPNVPVARGAIDWLEARARSGQASALDLFHLGYLLYRRKAHDENAHPDREAFRAAVEKEPGNAAFHAYLSFVSASTGEFSVNREENARRQELEETLALDPGYARAALLLADYYLRSLRQVDRAEEYLAKALAVAPDSVEARLLEIDIAGARSWDALERRLCKALLARPEAQRNGAALRRLAANEAGQGRIEKASLLLEAALKLDFADQAARAKLIEIEKAHGEADGALALLAERLSLEPFDTDAYLERARILAGTDRFDDAAKALEQALAIAPEDDRFLAELARVRLLAGDKDRALALFDRALELNPKLVDVQKYVEFLRETEKPFEDEFRIDPEAVIAEAAKIPLDPEVSARTLLKNVVSKVNRDGTSSEYTEEIVRIENTDGIQDYDTVAVAYAVGEQKATIRRATVVKKDGRREEARIDNYGAERDGGEFAQYAQRGVDLPTLEVGDIVIFEHRVDDLKQSFFGDYFGHTHFFQAMEPVEWSRYTLVDVAGRTFYFNPRHLDGVPMTKETRPDGRVVYSWEKRHMPRIQQEPNMPPYAEVAPCIQVSTFKDWDAFARWYWNLVRKQQEVSDEMRAKVEELTKNAKTRDEKIRAIYDFVVTDVRYNDKWEFGVHGFKPYNAATIFARRFGDCKDKATLIVTMLSVAGVKAFPVLIDGESRRGNEDLTLPLMNHFNHCIAYVPGPAPDGGDGWFLDGTAQDHEATNLPNMDYGATCLVVKPEGGELKRVKWPDPLSENGIREKHKVELKRDGGAVVESEIEPGGVYAVVTRSQFTNVGERSERIEKLYGRAFAGAAVKEAEWSDLKSLETPVKVRFRMEVPRFAKQTAGGYQLEEIRSLLFRFIYADRMTDFSTKAERKFDVVLPVPSGVDETIEYVLPEGFALKHAPDDVRLDSEFGTYVKHYEHKGNILRVTRRLEVKVQRIPVAKYQAWREFTTAIDRADDERATIKKGGLEE
jgi:tetratricopeptide (TPR) repeat protein